MISQISHSVFSRNLLNANSINPSYIGNISADLCNHLSSASFLKNNYRFGSRQQLFLQIDRLKCFSNESNRINNEAEMNCRYGLQYYEGKGTQQDYEKAVYYYRLAADKGNVQAQFSLGILYYCGIGMKAPDKDTAFRYLKQAALSGHAKAQYCYGICLANGEGVRINRTKAVRYFRISADNGYDEAQYCYGRCLFNAFGIKKNYTEAAKYFKKALDQGNAKAAFFYGLCLHQGLGVKEDKNETLKYLKYAADNNIDDAKKLVEIMEKTGSNYCRGKTEDKIKNQIQNKNNENKNENREIKEKDEISTPKQIQIIPNQTQFKTSIDSDDVSMKPSYRLTKPVHYSNVYSPPPVVK